MRHLSLVPPLSADRTDSTGPAPATPRSTAAGRPAAYVPVRLLLAASGRCSCDACCADALRTRRGSSRSLHVLR